ncbi:MAG: hypothetical protein R3C24_20200, partial [Cyanobacteriota/Melainabacteria group bacterium]
ENSPKGSNPVTIISKLVGMVEADEFKRLLFVDVRRQASILHLLSAWINYSFLNPAEIVEKNDLKRCIV